MAKGIPVLIFDSAIDGEQGKDFISFVATDNLAAGKLGGKHLMELIGKGGKAILFRHMEGHESTTAREAGALEEFKAADADILVENRYSGETSARRRTTALNMIDMIRAGRRHLRVEPDGVRRAAARPAAEQPRRQGEVRRVRQLAAAGRRAAQRRDRRPGRAGSGEHGLHEREDDGRAPRGREIEPVVNTSVHLVTRENMDDAEIAPLLK